MINKIPKPILVGAVLVIALVFFIYNEPLKDECAVQSALFTKNTRGILSSAKKSKGRTQFAQMTYWKDMCLEGSSLGSCDDYFSGLRTVTKEIKSFSQKCLLAHVENDAGFSKQITDGIKIMALLAWGSKPPAGLAERRGWLSDNHIMTFCGLKDAYIQIVGQESYEEFREQIYKLYPDSWSDKIEIGQRKPEERPRAYKTVSNPQGTLKKNEVYERSLFSMRCDLLM